MDPSDRRAKRPNWADDEAALFEQNEHEIEEGSLLSYALHQSTAMFVTSSSAFDHQTTSVLDNGEPSPCMVRSSQISSMLLRQQVPQRAEGPLKGPSSLFTPRRACVIRKDDDSSPYTHCNLSEDSNDDPRDEFREFSRMSFARQGDHKNNHNAEIEVRLCARSLDSLLDDGDMPPHLLVPHVSDGIATSPTECFGRALFVSQALREKLVCDDDPTATDTFDDNDITHQCDRLSATKTSSTLPNNKSDRSPKGLGRQGTSQFACTPASKVLSKNRGTEAFTAHMATQSARRKRRNEEREGCPDEHPFQTSVPSERQPQRQGFVEIQVSGSFFSIKPHVSLEDSPKVLNASQGRELAVPLSISASKASRVCVHHSQSKTAEIQSNNTPMECVSVTTRNACHSSSAAKQIANESDGYSVPTTQRLESSNPSVTNSNPAAPIVRKIRTIALPTTHYRSERPAGRITGTKVFRGLSSSHNSRETDKCSAESDIPPLWALPSDLGRETIVLDADSRGRCFPKMLSALQPFEIKIHNDDDDDCADGGQSTIHKLNNTNEDHTILAVQAGETCRDVDADSIREEPGHEPACQCLLCAVKASGMLPPLNPDTLPPPNTYSPSRSSEEHTAVHVHCGADITEVFEYDHSVSILLPMGRHSQITEEAQGQRGGGIRGQGSEVGTSGTPHVSTALSKRPSEVLYHPLPRPLPLSTDPASLSNRLSFDEKEKDNSISNDSVWNLANNNNNNNNNIIINYSGDNNTATCGAPTEVGKDSDVANDIRLRPTVEAEYELRKKLEVATPRPADSSSSSEKEEVSVPPASSSLSLTPPIAIDPRLFEEREIKEKEKLIIRCQVESQSEEGDNHLQGNLAQFLDHHRSGREDSKRSKQQMFITFDNSTAHQQDHESVQDAEESKKDSLALTTPKAQLINAQEKTRPQSPTKSQQKQHGDKAPQNLIEVDQFSSLLVSVIQTLEDVFYVTDVDPRVPLWCPWRCLKDTPRGLRGWGLPDAVCAAYNGEKSKGQKSTGNTMDADAGRSRQGGSRAEVNGVATDSDIDNNENSNSSLDDKDDVLLYPWQRACLFEYFSNLQQREESSYGLPSSGSSVKGLNSAAKTNNKTGRSSIVLNDLVEELLSGSAVTRVDGPKETSDATSCNLLYSAPTGGGKTLVAEVIMLRCCFGIPLHRPVNLLANRRVIVDARMRHNDMLIKENSSFRDESRMDNIFMDENRGMLFAADILCWCHSVLENTQYHRSSTVGKSATNPPVSAIIENQLARYQKPIPSPSLFNSSADSGTNKKVMFIVPYVALAEEKAETFSALIDAYNGSSVGNRTDQMRQTFDEESFTIEGHLSEIGMLPVDTETEESGSVSNEEYESEEYGGEHGEENSSGHNDAVSTCEATSLTEYDDDNDNAATKGGEEQNSFDGVQHRHLSGNQSEANKRDELSRSEHDDTAARAMLIAALVREAWLWCRVVELERYVGHSVGRVSNDGRESILAPSDTQESNENAFLYGDDHVVRDSLKRGQRYTRGSESHHEGDKAISLPAVQRDFIGLEDALNQSSLRFARLKNRYAFLLRLEGMQSNQVNPEMGHSSSFRGTRTDKVHGTTGPSAAMSSLLSSVSSIKRVQCHAGQKGHRSLSHDVLVCTIEKANVLLNLLIERGRASELSCVVVDEVHQIREHGRGYILELLLTKLIGLSAVTLSPLSTQKSLRESPPAQTSATRPSPETVRGINMTTTGKTTEPSKPREKSTGTKRRRESDAHVRGGLTSSPMASSSPRRSPMPTVHAMGYSPIRTELSVPPSATLKVIGMSATLSNAPTLCEWMKKAQLFVTDFRPVPLLEHYVIQGAVFMERSRTSSTECATMAAPDQNTVLATPFSFVRSLPPFFDKDGVLDKKGTPPVSFVNAWAQQTMLIDRDLQTLAAEGALGGHQVLVFCPSRAMCESGAEIIVHGLGRLTNWPYFLPSHLRPKKKRFTNDASEGIFLAFKTAESETVVSAQHTTKAIGTDGPPPPPLPLPLPPKPDRSIIRLSRDRKALLKSLKDLPGSVNGACVVSLRKLRVIAEQRLRQQQSSSRSAAPPRPPQQLQNNTGGINLNNQKNYDNDNDEHDDDDADDVEVSVVAFGVAFHHAALTGEERRLIEKGYRAGTLWCLCCTTTLATGVNLPTRRVIFRSIKVADQMLDSGQYRQAAGRAGRKGLDTLGESYILCRPGERLYVERQLMASSLPPIVSNFSMQKRGMVRVLLEGIVTGSIRNVFDVQNAIEGTLLCAALKEKPRNEDDQPQKDVEDGKTKPAHAGAAVPLKRALNNTNNSYARSNDTAQPEPGRSEIVYSTAKSALEFLEQNQFIGWDSENGGVFSATALGEAAVASSIAPDEAILLFRDLSKARRCICLDHNAEDLQLLFLCTPYFHGIEPNWSKFHGDHFMSIPSDVRQNVCGPLLGIDEGQLFQWAMVPPRHGAGGNNTMMYGVTARQTLASGGTMGLNNTGNSVQQADTSLTGGGGGVGDLTILRYKRFYVALILWEVIREVPQTTICRKFPPLSRAELNRLTDLASSFASMTSSFASALGWWFFPPLFDTMAARLSVGVEPDLLPLMKIEGLTARRARELARKGYRTPLAVACATVQELESVLSKRAPFAVTTSAATTTESGKRYDNLISKGKNQKRPREDGGNSTVNKYCNGNDKSGEAAATPQRPQTKCLDEEAIVPVALQVEKSTTVGSESAASPTGTFPKPLPSTSISNRAGANNNTSRHNYTVATTNSSTTTRFYQIDTKRLAIRIIEAAKEALQAEAKEMSETAAEAGIFVPVPQISSVTLPVPSTSLLPPTAAGAPHSTLFYNSHPTHGIGHPLSTRSSDPPPNISVSWTVVDCGNAYELIGFATAVHLVVSKNSEDDTNNANTSAMKDLRDRSHYILVSLQLLGRDGQILEDARQTVDAVVFTITNDHVGRSATKTKKINYDDPTVDAGTSLCHAHIFRIINVHQPVICDILRPLLYETVFENPNVTVVGHDLKTVFHLWRTIGLIHREPVINFNSGYHSNTSRKFEQQPRLARGMNREIDSHRNCFVNFAATVKCQLFDTLIADWLLEPEDRAGSRKMSLDQLCNFHRIRFDSAVAHKNNTVTNNNNESTPLILANHSNQKIQTKKEDPSANYRHIRIPKTPIDANNNVGDTQGKEKTKTADFLQLYAASCSFADSILRSLGIPPTPNQNKPVSDINADSDLLAKTIRNIMQWHNNHSSSRRAAGVFAEKNQSDIDLKSERKHLTRQRQQCTNGVKLLNLARALSTKMKQFDGRSSQQYNRSSSSSSSNSSSCGDSSSDDESNETIVLDNETHSTKKINGKTKTFRLTRQMGRLQRQPPFPLLEDYFYEIEMKMVLVLFSMESSGIGFDPNRYEWLLHKMKARSAELTAEAYAVTGQSNWELSNVQDCAKMLFDVLGMPCLERTFDAKYLPKKLLKSAARGTGRGGKVARESRSTKASVLNGLVKLFPDARLPLIIKEYRTMEGWSEKYLRPLLWCWQVQQQQQQHDHGGGFRKTTSDNESSALRSPLLLRTGRVHGEFLQTATATGRLSMNDPNLQTIPHPISFTMSSGEVVDVKLRQAYVAENHHSSGERCESRNESAVEVNYQEDHSSPDLCDDPWLLVSADYAQIEARLLAHFSRDPKLLAAFAADDAHRSAAREEVMSGNDNGHETYSNRPLDVFERLAAQIFHSAAATSSSYTCVSRRTEGKAMEQVVRIADSGNNKDNNSSTSSTRFVPIITPEERRAAKTLCYGMIYGKGAAAIADDVEVTLEEAAKLLSDFNKTYQVATKFIETFGSSTSRKGFVKTLFGRRRWLPYADSNNPRRKAASDRIAINTLCQGSAADIIKMAMVDLLTFQRDASTNTLCAKNACSPKHDGPDEADANTQTAKDNEAIGDSPDKPTRRSCINMGLQEAIRYLFAGTVEPKNESVFSQPPRARLLLQIHDELVFEVRKSDLQLLSTVLMRVMNVSEVLGLRVSLPVRVKAGPNWADMEQVMLDGTVTLIDDL